MAFQSRNLSVLAYANGFTLWHYTTADAAAEVDTQGYFDAAADMLRAGDMVMANVAVGTAPAAGIFLVNTSSPGVVDVSDLTAVGAANAD